MAIDATKPLFSKTGKALQTADPVTPPSSSSPAAPVTPPVTGAPVAPNTQSAPPVTSTAPGGIPNYYPRSTTGDPNADAAASYLGTFTPPRSQGDIATDLRKQNDELIRSIEASFDSVISQDQKQGDQRESEANAQAVMSGLTGSPDAFTAIDKTRKDNAEVIKADQAQKSAAVQQVLSKISSDSVTMAQTEKENATKSAEDILARRTKAETDAVDNLKSLASSGVTSADALKQYYPDQYQHILDVGFNGDTNLMKANFILNAPAGTYINLDKPIMAGTMATFLKQVKTPDGSLKIVPEQVDLGVQVPSGYKGTKVGDNYVLAPDNFTPDPNDPRSTADQFKDKIIVQNFAPSQKDQLAIQNSQKNLEVKTQREEMNKSLLATRLIARQALNTNSPIVKYLAIVPAMGRIKAAADQINAGNVNPANLGDLVEAVTQVNSGGGQITEGKLSLTKNSQSYGSQLTTLWQKVQGEGGVVSEKTAKQMIDLAQKVFDIYQGEYKNETATYNARLKNTPLGDISGYSPLTDITNLSAIKDGSYEQSLQSSISGTSSGAPTDLTSSGFTDNGDGTYTSADGTVVTDNGDGTYSAQ